MLEVIGTTLLGLIILVSFSAIVIYAANNTEKVFIIFLSTVCIVAVLLVSYAIGYIATHNM